MTRTLTFAASAIALLMTPQAGKAQQNFPTKPIRVITASAPGGLSDIFIRSVGDQLQKKWGQPLIIESRPGGNWNIGLRACAESPPDGYTICIISNDAVTYNPLTFSNMTVDVEASLVPMTNLFFITQALGVNATLGAKSVNELVQVVKAKPKTFSYSTPALPLVVFMNDLNKEKDIDLIRVPFKGGNAAINGVLTMVTPITFLGIGNMVSHLQSGAMNALLVDGDRANPLAPGVPSIAEYGYKRPLTRSYFALFAPAGTPTELITKIVDDVRSVASDPLFRERNFTLRGLEPVLNSPEEFAWYLQRDRALAKSIVEEAGIKRQ
jgi:tripartite-type tricarboxylate transporter receptor subunit TctC